MDPLFLAPPRPYSPYAAVRTRRMARPRLVDVSTARTTDSQRTDEIERIDHQLARVGEMMSWGRMQNDAWDRLCPFIFRVRSAELIDARARLAATAHQLDPEEFAAYALRRWYCFWGARLAELLFETHHNVVPGPPKDRLVDFTIDGVPFDLKTSEVPSPLAGLLADPVANASSIAAWLYRHQSRERRFHLGNRLFLVLHHPGAPGEAWRLRGDVAALRASIDDFLANPRYVKLTLPDPHGYRHTITTAVIPVAPVAMARQLGFVLDLDPPRQRVPTPPALSDDRQISLPLF